MSITEGRWEGNTPFPDLTIFVGADEIRNTSGTATLTLNASGDYSLNIGNSQACVFTVSEASLLRSGVYASSYDQQQFGTAAGVAGPSTVAGTSGPLGLKPGFPPLAASQMATLGAIQTGPIAKGLQINSVTAIYSVTALALTLAQIGVTKTQFANNAALVVTNVLAKAANGLPTAIGTGASNPYCATVAMTAPVAMTPGSVAGTELLIELDLTTGASGTARLYGFSVNCSFNLA